MLSDGRGQSRSPAPKAASADSKRPRDIVPHFFPFVKRVWIASTVKLMIGKGFLKTRAADRFALVYFLIFFTAIKNASMNECLSRRGRRIS